MGRVTGCRARANSLSLEGQHLTIGSEKGTVDKRQAKDRTSSVLHESTLLLFDEITRDASLTRLPSDFISQLACKEVQRIGRAVLTGKQ